MERIKSADALKGLGALCIAGITHYEQCFSVTEHLSLWQQYALVAVEMFFLLSGFLISVGYRDRITARSVSFGSFMCKRIKHVYPLFLLSTIAVAALEILYRRATGVLFKQDAFDIWYFLQNVFLMQGGISFDVYSFNTPCWFIGTITVMYMLYYFVTYISSRKGENRTVYCVLSAILVLLGFWFYARNGSGAIFNYFKLGRGLVSFFMGVLMREIYEKAPKRAQVSFSILLILVYAIFEWRASRWTGARGDIMMYAAFFVIPALVWVSFCMPGVKHVLSIAPLTWLGKISMSIYVWHFPLLLILDLLKSQGILTIDFGTALGWGIYMLVLLAIAVISYFLLERNMDKILAFLKKLFITGWEKKQSK